MIKILMISTFLLFSVQNVIPEEVLNNLDLFQQLDFFENMNILQENDADVKIKNNDIIVSSVTIKSTTTYNTNLIKNKIISTSTWRNYDKK